MGYGLGIDIGSVTLAAAVWTEGTARLERLGTSGPLRPSAVGLRPDGTPGPAPDSWARPANVPPGHLVRRRLGDSAGECPGILPGHVFHRMLGDSTPFRLGDRTFTAGELLTALLAGVLDQVTARRGSPPDRVVVTYPSMWGPGRREQFAAVVHRAGVPPADLTLVTEAEATIVQHRAETGQEDAETRPVVVYDAGGGTFDATVMMSSRVVGAPETIEFSGGVDIEDVLLRYLDRVTEGLVSLLGPSALVTVLHECNRAKETLSSRTEVEMVLPGRRVRLTRDRLERLLLPYVRPGLPTLRRALRSAEVDPADLGLVLATGGSSRIPFLVAALAEDLGRPVTRVREPQYAVALGAARLAGR